MKTTEQIHTYCVNKAAALDMSKPFAFSRQSAYGEIAAWSAQVDGECLVELVRESYADYQEMLKQAHRTRRSNWQHYITTYQQVAHYAGIAL